MFGFLKEKLSKLKERITSSNPVHSSSSESVEVRGVEVEEPSLRTQKTEARQVTGHEEARPVMKGRKESIKTKIKKVIKRRFKLSEDELDGYLWELELILLESDVAADFCESLIKDMRERLAEKDFDSGKDVFDQMINELKDELRAMFARPFDVLSLKGKEKPVVLMFIGPNGAGKTTTIAKLARQALDRGHSVIFAASDTFRAASIEQLDEHAKRLGVRLVRHKYGSDPAAVAYDAVKSAKANNIDFVMIDTAGRQETNKNLMEELKKIKRVVNPDYIIYVDEAIAGNVIKERLEKFGELGISGVILTKMDLDAKGGGAITAASLGIPILYIGIGQEYSALQAFNVNDFLKGLLG